MSIVHGSMYDVIKARAANAPTSNVLLARTGPPLTSSALRLLVDHTREHLNSHGLGRGDRIAVVVPDHAIMQSAYIACMCCSVAVPINPGLTPFELKQLFTTINVKAVITQAGTGHVAALAQELSLDLFILHPIPDKGVGGFEVSGGTLAPPRKAGPSKASDLASVLTSSGTTGKPKAIPETHALIIDRVRVDIDILGLNASDVTINFRPPYLAGPLNIGLVTSVYTGGAIVVPKAFDENELFDDLIRFGITWYTGGPAYHRAILDAAPAHAEALKQSKLRFIRSAGYALPSEMQDDIERTFGVPCVQKYGSSEAGLISCNPLPPGLRKPGTSGPVRDCEIRIISHDGTDLGEDEVGEILVRGPKVFDGYDDPEMTHNAFRDGWFCTGDLGSIDADGYLSISGRANEVINRGGQKISPVEVEAVFSTLPGVAAALCFHVAHATLGSTASIAIVPDGTRELDQDELRRLSANKLARFKVPETVLTCDELPRGPTGKPLRLGAAAYFGVTADETKDAEKLRPPTDRLEEIWCRILKCDQLHDDQNFTRAGGDSIRAVRLQAELESALGIILPPDIMYGEGATPTGLRAIVNTAQPADNRKRGPTLPRRSDLTADVPLTSGQQRLWTHSKLFANRALYNSSHAFRFPEALNLTAIQRSANKLAERHEALRSTFPVVDGRPVQRFAPHLEPPVEVLDLRDIAEDQREEELLRAVKKHNADPIDLENGPLYRLLAYRIDNDTTVVQVAMHHIVTDAMSSTIYCKEFVACYEAYSQGHEPNLPEICWGIGDLAKDMDERLSSEDGKALVQSWIDTLSDVHPFIEIPRDFDRPKTASRKGQRLFFQYSPELARKVRDLSADIGTSPYAMLLSAFEMLVSRLTGRGSFIVGMPINLRPPNLNDQITGFGLNTLPLRADIDPSTPFRDQVKGTQRKLQDAQEKREVPLDEIVRALADQSDRSAPPLIQILFGFVPKGSRPQDIKYSMGDLWHLGAGGSRFDFSVMIDDTVDGLGGIVEFATDLYSEETVRRFVERFSLLIGNLVADPSRLLDDYDILPEAERAQIKRLSNGPDVDYPCDVPIQSVFSHIAEQNPDLPAIEYGGCQLSYRELDEQSHALAIELIAEGITPGDVIGLSTERTAAAIVAMLGIMKAGGAYQPLDPKFPKQRIANMIEDAQTRMVLLQDGSELKLGADVTTRPIDAGTTKSARDLQLPDVSARDLAYVIFTSGSTGRPKGVEVEHRSVIQTVVNQTYIDIGPGIRVASTCSFGFDVSVFEVFGALLNGATIVLPAKQNPTINDYADLLTIGKTDIAVFSSGLFREMADLRIDCFKGVRQLVLSGDAVPPDRARLVLDTHPECIITNAYGPTETTIFSVCGTLDPEVLDRGLAPLGRPIANSSAWILDARMRPVPLGSEGDLYLGGDGVSRGYCGREDLTAAVFVPDPFSNNPDAILYNSGDRARFLPDGRLEFLGRLDSQLKIAGFRVELGEIETVLRQHEAVSDARAVPLRDGSTVKHIAVAVIADDPNAPPEPAKLHAHLVLSLPDYMIPLRFAFVDRFPLNSSGKIDLSALAELRELSNDVPVGVEVTAPRTPIENLLFSIWSHVLDRDDFGIDQNFFSIGGTSLQILQLGFHVTDAIGLDIPPIKYFENATIRGMGLLLFQELSQLENDQEEQVQ